MVSMIERRTYKQTMLRVRWVDWVRLRHLFPAQKGESAASYIQRLVEFHRGLQ